MPEKLSASLLVGFLDRTDICRHDIYIPKMANRAINQEYFDCEQRYVSPKAEDS